MHANEFLLVFPSAFRSFDLGLKCLGSSAEMPRKNTCGWCRCWSTSDICAKLVPLPLPPPPPHVLAVLSDAGLEAHGCCCVCGSDCCRTFAISYQITSILRVKMRQKVLYLPTFTGQTRWIARYARNRKWLCELENNLIPVSFVLLNYVR